MTDAVILAIVTAIPSTLISLATLVQAIKARAEIKLNTDITSSNHVLANDMSTRALGTIAVQAERIAGLTGLPTDINAALQARADHNIKVNTDAVQLAAVAKSALSFSPPSSSSGSSSKIPPEISPPKT